MNKATFLNEIAKMLRVYQEADSRTEEYQYDLAGNRKLLRVTLARTLDYNSQYYTNTDRLKTDGKYAFVYDEAGNMVKKGNTFTISGDTVIFTETSGEGVEYWEYKYDLLNRLIEVTKNGNMLVANYAYDPEGFRVVKKAKGETTHYVFQGTEPIFEKNITTGKIKSFVYALGKHLARVDGAIGDPEAKQYWYVTDHVGSIRAVTDKDGEKVWSTDYLAFGTQFEKSADTDFEELHSFTGKEYDPDTGLHYFNARWMDSETGRFISEDTIPIDPNDPRTLNLYIYGNNNPIIYIDSTGHKPYVTKVCDDIYMYMSTSRQEHYVKALSNCYRWGFLPVKLSEITTGQRFISNKDKQDALADVLSTVTAFTEGFENLSNGLLHTIGELSQVIGMLLNVISLGETYTDKSHITDQIVGKVIGIYLESSTEEGVVEKYAYAEARIAQMVKDGEITYDTNILGNVSEVYVSKQTKDQLTKEIMLIDAARVKEGKETENQFRSNYGAEFDTNAIIDTIKSSDSRNTGQTTPSDTGASGNPEKSGDTGDNGGSTGQKIICVELFRQRLMEKNIYEADEAFGEMLAQKYSIILVGYHVLAKPVVHYMKKSQNFTHVIWFVAKPWAYEMAHIMGKREQGNVAGKVLMLIGFLVCLLVGLTVSYPFYSLVFIILGFTWVIGHKYNKKSFTKKGLVISDVKN